MFKSGRPEPAGGWSQTYRHDRHTRPPEAAKLRRVSIENVPIWIPAPRLRGNRLHSAGMTPETAKTTFSAFC